MSSRRSSFFQHYLRGSGPQQVLLKSSADADRHRFRGAQIVPAVVVRSDLNGYSKWAQEKDLGQRTALLSDYFTKVVALIDQSNGVYFRDEGDCVVSLFSPYFGMNNANTAVPSFAKQIVQGNYGRDNLTAKVMIAVGNIAIFQKAHEVGTDDWSAEGDPFVRVARMEQAVASSQKIYYYTDEYRRHFEMYQNLAQSGEPYYWLISPEKTQIQGLGQPGGWTELTVVEYLREKRIAA